MAATTVGPTIPARSERLRFGPTTTLTGTAPAPAAIEAAARAASALPKLGEPVIVEGAPAGDDYEIWGEVALELAEESFDAVAEAWPEA